LKARARRRTEAREKYEDDVECVKQQSGTRSVHMLSVAHLGPGKEIEATSTVSR
jgi:hypothetical protein